MNPRLFTGECKETDLSEENQPSFQSYNVESDTTLVISSMTPMINFLNHMI